MAANIETANPDRIGTMPRTDDILRSRVAFAVVEEEIAHPFKSRSTHGVGLSETPRTCIVGNPNGNPLPTPSSVRQNCQYCRFWDPN